MRFEWDENKNQSNRAKHGLSFETALLVFDDPFALSEQDRFENGEERWSTIGLVDAVLLVFVAHTYRFDAELQEESFRIISARRATREEVKRYENPYR